MEEGRSLTEVVFAVLRLAQLRFEGLEALLARLQETDALHVGHALALLIVDLVREVHLVREEYGLCRG